MIFLVWRFHEIMMKNYFAGLLVLTAFFFLIFQSKLENHLENELFEEESNDLFYPADIEMIKRTFPFYNFDQNIYAKAISQLKIKKESQKLNKNNNLENLRWEFVGPTNIAGRVVDIEFNPKNPNIVYAAAATGGVFKSEDMGKNWFPIFDNQPCLSIGDICIDPNNPDTIYVGTGEANGGHNNFPGIGIFKSTDAGNTWAFIGLDSSVSIGRIIIDPNNSQKIIVAAVGSSMLGAGADFQ